MTDPDMGNWSHGYNPNGNLKSQLDARSQTISFTYDKIDRTMQKTYSTGEAPSTYYENVNGSGQRSNMSHSSCNTKLRYGVCGNIHVAQR